MSEAEVTELVVTLAIGIGQGLLVGGIWTLIIKGIAFAARRFSARRARLQRPEKLRVRRQPYTGMVMVAAWLAGAHRDMLPSWMDHLGGDPDNGITLTRWQQRRAAAGFLVAGMRYRLHDAFKVLWRPVDWLLAVESRTNAFIATVVSAQAVYIVDGGGIPALMKDIWEPCGICGAGLYVLTRWLRRIRGIELASRESSSGE